MTIVQNFLNIRHSTRNLSDHDFEKILPILASELVNVDYHQTYSNEILLADWQKLIKWHHTDTNLNSTNRIGMKLSEHFFKNFYDIKTNKGISFSNSWNKENLEKILRWNRKSHSTPYLSELKRGVYFCCGLPKSTMYRPQMMKLACIRYNAKRVLDPCAGWGGRMLGAVSSGATYTAFEPNTVTYNNLLNLIDFLQISDKVNIINDRAENMYDYKLGKFDLILTSPPYFDLEVYSDEKTQSVYGITNYKEWSTKFLKKIIHSSLDHLTKDGHSCWNVAKVGKNDMELDVLNYHEEVGFVSKETLTVTSSKRQAHQTSDIKKSTDRTVVFQQKV